MQVDPGIPGDPRYWWRIALELRLRQCHGDAFQDFFASVMGHLHGSDYVPVRAFGRLGDKGCDGYLQSSGQVFQCYGALNGETNKVATLTKKIRTDFATAKKKLGPIMKEWHMVLNLVDGLPIEAIEVLEELKAASRGLKIGYIGKEGIEERVFGLSNDRITFLLGPAATPADVKNLDVATLRRLVDEVAVADDAPLSNDVDLKQVPVGKLSHNALPVYWQRFIRAGWPNTHVVATYFARHPDPLRGEQIGAVLKAKYRALKAQSLQPSTIMAELLNMVTGIGSVPPEKQVAAQALLTHFFESCDIFEREPVESGA